MSNSSATHLHAESFGLNSRLHYARELRQHLPAEVFKPAPFRLLWMAAYFAIVVASVVAILHYENFLVRLFFSVVIGHFLGVLGFMGHEILHGTVVRNRTLLRFLGGMCMVHWGIHPNAWIVWHNGRHHHETNHGFDDPDCFGRQQLYQHSRVLQAVEKYTPGSGTLRSYLFLFFWFSFHAVWVIFLETNVFRNKKEQRQAQVYLVMAYVVWAVAAGLATSWGLLFLMLIPIAISNFIMMSYVVTNHFISPLTEDTNDPLINSLTVRSLKWLETLHLNNNFHVEHHLLPSVNPSHASSVQQKAKELWPDRYQEMPHAEAIARIYKSPRFYKDDTTLINPRTRETTKTLLHQYLLD